MGKAASILEKEIKQPVVVANKNKIDQVEEQKSEVVAAIPP